MKHFEKCVVCGKLSEPWLWCDDLKGSACEKCAKSFDNKTGNEVCSVCKGKRYIFYPHYLGKEVRRKSATNSYDKFHCYKHEPCHTCNGSGLKEKKPLWQPPKRIDPKFPWILKKSTK